MLFFYGKQKMNGRAGVVLLLLPFLFSCATYNNKLASYYSHIGSGNYIKAQSDLANNSFIQQPRNKLIYYMEQGKLCHLLGLYDSSNHFFNLADAFIETKRKSAGDVVAGGLLNPMTQSYMGEDFERFMIHYYKALNYLYLHEPDGARVEARRITLSNNALEDKTRSKNKYQEDAFSLIVQGLIYELNGEPNNAFISYRNAVDLFLGNESKSYYGVMLPTELVKDMYHTAAEVGFTDQINLYERKTGIKYAKSEAAEGGELVIFLEKGMAPVKMDQRFTLTNAGDNSFFFNGPYGDINIPFDYGYAGWNQPRPLNEFRVITIAIPVYNVTPIPFVPAQVTVGNLNYSAERVHNINELAAAVLSERMLKEVSAALVRAIVKKTTEVAAAEAAKAAAKNDKKKESGEAAGLAAGLLVNMINTATEKADTRNWQSLPGTIQYVRVPLQKGENQITINAMGKQKKITVTGNGKLQLYNWCLLR
ncbi:MAG: COG3014 family protein [Sediminibacterium sp.]|jgi:uncharacterized protein|nr:hypothetical protein [Chitinophagaceae bacterium]MCA6446908.1 hypothetical protein [Chitinophagaceae bacterium]